MCNSEHKHWIICFRYTYLYQRMSLRLNTLYQIAIFHPRLLPSILIDVSEIATLTPSMWNNLARLAIDDDNLEELIRVVHTILDSNSAPSIELLSRLVPMACEWDSPRLALEIARGFESSPLSSQQLPRQCWAKVLAKSSICQYVSNTFWR
jgi:hypothetical protein